MYLVIYIRF